MTDLLVYGSYGYTGDLVAREATERGLDVTLAGRTTERVEAQATDLDCPHRVFSLAHPGVVREQVADVDVVVNCAGPFVDTAEPLVEACIDEGTHYVDITGEIAVLEHLAEYDREAEKAGVMVLPGAGFDVVPTDCLAAHLKERVPRPTHLELGLSPGDSLSPGTAKTTVRSLGEGGAVRRNGAITPVPGDWQRREIDFGHGPRETVTVPWGDVATAYYSTGIPNVEVYMALPPAGMRFLDLADRFDWLAGSRPVRAGLEALVDRFVTGPSEHERRTGYALLWGEVENDEGDLAVCRMRTPEPYAFTAETSVEVASRALSGDAPAGYQTPSSAYGADFVLYFEGVQREDEVDAAAIDIPAED